MNPSLSDRARLAREAVALACRTLGFKRGWAIAGQALGVSEHTARALTTGSTSGATIPEERALAARLAFARARAEQLRAELEYLEAIANADTLEARGSRVAVAGQSLPRHRRAVSEPGEVAR